MSHISLRLVHTFSSSCHWVYSNNKHRGIYFSNNAEETELGVVNVKTKVRVIDKGGSDYLVLGSQSRASRKELWVLETWRAPTVRAGVNPHKSSRPRALAP